MNPTKTAEFDAGQSGGGGGRSQSNNVVEVDTNLNGVWRLEKSSLRASDERFYTVLAHNLIE